MLMNPWSLIWDHQERDQKNKSTGLPEICERHHCWGHNKQPLAISQKQEMQHSWHIPSPLAKAGPRQASSTTSPAMSSPGKTSMTFPHLKRATIQRCLKPRSAKMVCTNASSARVHIRGMGPLSPVAEVHIGDGAVTVSLLHPSWPQSSTTSALVAHLQLENLQFWRTSDKVCMMDKIMNCQRKPWRKCAQAQKLQLQGAQFYTSSKSPTPEQTHTCILTSHWQSTVELCPPARAPSAVTGPAFRCALMGLMEGHA